MQRRATIAAGVLWTILLAAVLAPSALADTEPNGAVFMPEGPIAGGQEIAGTLGPGDDDDWYVLHVDGVHQLHLTSPQTGSPFGGCIAVALTDENGIPVANDYTSPAGESTFYVHVWPVERPIESCGPDQSYAFRIDPAHALVDGPEKLPVRGTAEPNDSRSTAGGPLAPAAWYHSTLETVNDTDWLRFYVRRGLRRIDVQAVVYGPHCDYHEITLRSARGSELVSSRGTHEIVTHLTRRLRGPARLYVRIANGPVPSPLLSCVGTATVVRVAPDDAIMSAAEVKRACAEGRSATRRNKRRVAADRRAIARAEARGGPSAALRRKLGRDRRALRRSSAAVSAYCSR